MPLDPYLDGDPMENHPLFKSEEQARIEETLDGEPAEQLSSTRLPWPGEETVENVEGAALDEALWTGRRATSTGATSFLWQSRGRTRGSGPAFPRPLGSRP